MNNKIATDSNIFVRVRKLIYDNFKIIISVLVSIFLIFLGYQLYSYYKLSIIQKNSITYFSGKNLNNDEEYYKLMEKLSDNNDFYSILSKLELVNLNIKNEDYKEAFELYISILRNNKIESVYKSAIATKAVYNFIDIQYKYTSSDFIPNIKELISFIDGNLTSYEGIKLELEYLLSITEIDLNNIDYKSSNKILDLHKVIIESENISSTIKERVNKIHEFQLYN